MWKTLIPRYRLSRSDPQGPIAGPCFPFRNLHHKEDAQFPLEPLQQLASNESAPDEELQITYVSGLTAAALSLGLTSALDYAWANIGTGIQNNRLFGAMKK